MDRRREPAPRGPQRRPARTLSSYKRYWDEWAQTWEFQALLKARRAAGDVELGDRFRAAAEEYVWSAAGRTGFVENARAMRKRVEETIPRREADREIKLGRGGLRDVEFTVQLLQLVHGRTDESLRVLSWLTPSRPCARAATSPAPTPTSCRTATASCEPSSTAPR